jgi:hypothetical protein
VLDDGGQGHRQWARQLADRSRPAGEAVDYCSPRRVGERMEDEIERDRIRTCHS